MSPLRVLEKAGSHRPLLPIWVAHRTDCPIQTDLHQLLLSIIHLDILRTYLCKTLSLIEIKYTISFCEILCNIMWIISMPGRMIKIILSKIDILEMDSEGIFGRTIVLS